MKNKILASLQEAISEFREDPKNKMHDWWDKWWEFMKDPKKKMREWWDKWWEFMKDSKKWWDKFKFKHPWWACLFQYGGLALLVGLVFHVSSILSGMANVDYFRYPLNETFRHPFNLTANLTINKSAEMNTTEIYAAEMYADNVRSILCTLVGSEAAIVAIVVSLTLIAIELTASAYSPRVIKVSLRNPDMWFLLLIYGVSIFYAIVLLKQLPYDSWIPYDDVSFAFWLGVFSYVALVPYLLNIIRLLSPTTIVRRVSEEIAEDKILKDILNYNIDKKRTLKGDETVEDQIQPILDIIYRSINNYDLETVRKGLGEIVRHAKNVIDPYLKLSDGNEKRIIDNNFEEKAQWISDYFCYQLKRIGRLAASKDDEGSTIEVIKNLENFGVYLTKAKLSVAIEQVLAVFETVGKIVTGKGEVFEGALKQTVASLGKVGKSVVDKGGELEGPLTEIVKLFKELAISAAKNHEESAVTEIAKSLKELGMTSSEDNVIKKIASAIGTVGVETVVNETTTLSVIKVLEEFGLDKDHKHATFNMIDSLVNIGKNAKTDKILEQVVHSIYVIGKKKKQIYARKAIDSLKELGGIAKNEKLETRISTFIKGLNSLVAN